MVNYYTKVFFIIFITMLGSLSQCMEVYIENSENGQKLANLQTLAVEKNEESFNPYDTYLKDTYFKLLSPEINNYIAQLVLGNTLNFNFELSCALKAGEIWNRLVKFSPDSKAVLTAH